MVVAAVLPAFTNVDTAALALPEVAAAAIAVTDTEVFPELLSPRRAESTLSPLLSRYLRRCLP